MSVSVRCSACTKTWRVSESKRGAKVKCPACGEAVRVPDDDGDDYAEDAPSGPGIGSRRVRKKKASGNAFAVPIAIAAAVSLALGVGFVVGRLNSSTPPVPAPAVVENSAAPARVIETPRIEVAPPTVEPAATATPTSESKDDEAPVTPESMSAVDEFFNSGMIPELRIQISDAEMEKLAAGPKTFVIGAPRPSVEGTLVENGQTTYTKVSIKLKGSAGSFRPVEDRPALSINVSKNEKNQTFHGLSKFHLNNSVQDNTYLHELVCEELFTAAKIPCTRVTHARVWLNQRDLGFYVLKSSFDKSFLKRHFNGASGNLYEGGFVQDVDVELERDYGKGPNDRSDLTALLSACREPDVAARWDRIDEILDVDEFISFMAMEMMVGHWDGYTANHNNYRLYFDSKSNKAHFLPHGMDQVFGDPNASIINYPSSIVSSAVMQNGEWRARFRERVTELLKLFSPTDGLLKRIDTVNERVRPVLMRISPQAAQEHDENVKRLKERIVARVENLTRQKDQPDPAPREFDSDGKLFLANWYPVSESPDAKLEILDLPKGPKAFSILCGKKSTCNASWRCKEFLSKGTYVFHAKIKSHQISAKEERSYAVGAGIRIDGMTRTNIRRGTAAWTPVEYEFTIEEEKKTVEFIAELRSKSGQVWYDASSLYLTRKSEE